MAGSMESHAIWPPTLEKLLRNDEPMKTGQQARRTKNPAWDAAWREIQAILDVEIEQLPAISREPFILCCLEHRTCAVVAKALRLKEGTVWSRVGRAKSRLQSRLAKRGISLTAVLAGAAVSGNAANAALPAGLIGSTAMAAAGLATSGDLVPGVVSPNVAALVKGMTKAVLFSQIKGARISPFVRRRRDCRTGRGCSTADSGSSAGL